MKKQILHLILFFSVFGLTAQTLPADTLKQVHVQKDTAAVNTPVAPTTTAAVAPVQTTPSQTLAPITVTTQTLHPTDPVIRHHKRPSETFKKENEEITTLYKAAYDKKTEIVLQNKRYRIYNNYITAGVGKCYNSGWKDAELNTAFDYHFHIQKNHFQAGALLAGPRFGDNNVVQLHVGYGYRLERCNYHWAVYGGLSYSEGYRLQQGYLQQPDTTYKVKLSTIGVYANVQFYYKLKFDYGLGASAFIDANSKQMLGGIRIELFFSGAYKGFKKINYTKEDERNNR